MNTIELDIEYARPKLARYQTQIIDSPARYTITEAATKTGKTTSHIVWLFECALGGKEGWNYWWVAPIFGQAKIAFERMKRFCATDDGIEFFKANLTDLTLTLPNGAVIHFKSADKPDSLYGEDVYACVFDEFTRAKETAWHALRSTLTATRGKIKFIGNVKGRGWGYKLAQKAKTLEGWAYFKLTAWDAVKAGILDAQEIQDAKAALPEHVFNELYLAIPSDDGGNPFGLKAIEKCVMPLSEKPSTVFGIDLAKSTDHTAIVGLDAHCKTSYLDKFQTSWGVTKANILRLPANVQCAIDSTGVGDPIVEELQKVRSGVHGFKFTSLSKQQLMEGLASAIQQGEISFPDGWLRDELDVFEYQYTKTGVKYSAPEGFHDDGVCALALAYHQFKNKVVFGTIDDD